MSTTDLVLQKIYNLSSGEGSWLVQTAEIVKGTGLSNEEIQAVLLGLVEDGFVEVSEDQVSLTSAGADEISPL